MHDYDSHAPDNGPAVVSGFADTVTKDNPSYPASGIADVHETGPSVPELDTIIPESRMDAFIAISAERQYQENVYGYQGETSSAHTILLIEEYLGRAKDAHARNEGVEIAHAVRKIAAIAVRAMEQLGVATRAEEDGPVTGCGG